MMQGFKQFFKEEWDRIVQSDLDLLRFTLYKNPDPEELKEVLEEDKKFILRYYDANDKEIAASASGTARGILTDKGDVYLWAQNPMDHKTLAKRIPVTTNVGFYVYQKKPNRLTISWWSSNKLAQETDDLSKGLFVPRRLSIIWKEMIAASPNIHKLFNGIPDISVDQKRGV
jgi:hypothetical protein